jgi:hypothetical protein
MQWLGGAQVTKVICTGFYCIDVESLREPGTESNSNTLVTVIKVIVGGVAPLLMPWCIKNQGIIAGPLTVLGVGLLSQFTIGLLVEYRYAVYLLSWYNRTNTDTPLLPVTGSSRKPAAMISRTSTWQGMHLAIAWRMEYFS